MKKHLFTILLSGVIASIASISVLILAKPYMVVEVESTQKAQTIARMDANVIHPLVSAPSDFVIAAKKGTESVVYIQSTVKSEDETYFTRKIIKNSGSGVIIDKNGIIVTNYHVVKNALDIKITLNNRKEYTARLIGHDEQTDIAVLKIDAESLPFLPTGDSDSISVGEWILAVGNPFQLRSSVTAGIISAKARSINLIEDHGIEAFIQTDAAVNSGNSGGALINTKGQLIGINTAILSSSGGYQGFSFAIPINLVRKIVKDILQYGVVQRGWLGVTVKNVSQEIANTLSLPHVAGVCIEYTTKDGAAQKAGLIENDVIVSINQHTTADIPSFMEQLSTYRPGDAIEIGYIRKGKSYKKNITLHNMLNTTELIAIRKDAVLKNIGLEVRDLTKNEVFKFGAKGVYVVSILHKSPIDATNMTPGYIITSINNQEVHSSQSLINLLKNLSPPYNFNGIYEQYTGKYPYTLEHIDK